MSIGIDDNFTRFMIMLITTLILITIFLHMFYWSWGDLLNSTNLIVEVLGETIYDHLERNFDNKTLNNCLFYKGDNTIIINPTYHPNNSHIPSKSFFGLIDAIYDKSCFQIIDVLVINGWEITTPLGVENTFNLDMIMLVKQK